MPEATEDPWVRAIANFRDVTRWIIAGIAGAVSLVVGTSPLTGLGGLEPSGARLWIGVAGGITGLVAFAFPFGAAVSVLGSRLVDIQEVANGTDRRRTRLREAVDARIRHRLPPRFPTLRALAEADAGLRREIQEPGQLDEHGQIVDPVKRALYAELTPYVTIALNVARFEEMRILFNNLCWILAISLPFVAAGFGIFAWAANPKKELSGETKQTNIHATIDLNGHLQEALDAAKLGQCRILSLADGHLECVAQAPAGAGAGTKIYLAAPARPLDIVALLEDALGKAATAKGGTQFSIGELAKLAANNFIETAARELGQKTVDVIFDGSGKHAQLGSLVMLIVRPPGDPQRPKPLDETVDVQPFATGLDRLPPRRLWKAPLVRLVQRADQLGCTIEVSGFADRRGSSATNLYLSLRRADRVARYLLDLGVPRARLSISPRGAYGERFETDYSNDLAVNRHVEVRLICRSPA